MLLLLNVCNHSVTSYTFNQFYIRCYTKTNSTYHRFIHVPLYDYSIKLTNIKNLPEHHTDIRIYCIRNRQSMSNKITAIFMLHNKQQNAENTWEKFANLVVAKERETKSKKYTRRKSFSVETVYAICVQIQFVMFACVQDIVVENFVHIYVLKNMFGFCTQQRQQWHQQHHFCYLHFTRIWIFLR